jgi:hypothetical protein
MSSEGDTFEKFLILEAQKEVVKVTKDAERLLKKNVQSGLYDKYTPKVYKRTNELKNSIVSKVSVNEGVTYFDENLLNHTSVITGEPVGRFVPKWTDKGHDDGKGSGMFHVFPARNFLDKTISQLEKKYGTGCVEKIDSI